MAFSFSNPAGAAFKAGSLSDKLGMIGTALGDDPTALLKMIQARQQQAGGTDGAMPGLQDLGVDMPPQMLQNLFPQTVRYFGFGRR